MRLIPFKLGVDEGIKPIKATLDGIECSLSVEYFLFCEQAYLKVFDDKGIYVCTRPLIKTPVSLVEPFFQTQVFFDGENIIIN